VREKEKGFLVLDAGDLMFKRFLNPIPENELEMATQKAHLVIESLNLMGYDALGIGDDDLSLGKEFLLEISKKANFPLLSSNILDEASGKTFFQPYLIKEINGLRIGIFSLLSPDVFLGPWDPRRKGLIFQNPIEAAQNTVKELQPKTDWIILLSHLGYPKDVELAQTVQGIHLIVGGHTGVHLVHPPFIKNTLILQTPSRGMYAGRLDLTLYNNEHTLYNITTRQSLENNLQSFKNRLNSKEAPEAEKAQWRRAKSEIERSLEQLRGKNEFTNTIFPLSEQMKDHPEIGKMVEAFKSKYMKIEKPVSPK
jgi:2',3'-cyclic-nucleotide 2'-phosphodiesterase (5'-nucleotidase family)